MNYSDLFIECINLFKQANYEMLIWIILVLVIILLFKQFKNDAEKCRVKEEQLVSKYLVEYSEIVYEINKYKRNEITFDLFYSKICELLPICSENISNIILECDINSNESIDQLIKNIISEYKSLKSADVYGLSRKLTNKAFDFYLYFYYNSSFTTIVTAILHTFISILAIMLTIGYTIKFSSLGTVDKVFFIITIISLCLYVVSIIANFELILSRRFKLKRHNIICIIYMIVSPCLLAIPIKWVSSLLLFVTIVGYEFFILPKTIKLR